MTRILRATALCAVALMLLAGDARPVRAQGSFAQGSIGATGGLVAGTAVSIGLIVANARMERDFIHGPEDIMSLQGVPIPVGLIAGGVLGASDPVRAERIGYFTAGGMALGSSLGALIGELMTDDDPSGKWAGFVMGGAAGVVLGILAGSL